MKILVTASTFPLHSNDGNPRFVYDLAEAMTAHGDVTALAPHAPGAPRSETLGKVKIRRFRYFVPEAWQGLTPRHGNGMRENMRGSLIAKVQVPLFLLSQTWATRRLVRELRPDIVNAHWIVPQGLTAALALGTNKHSRLALHVHAGDVYLLRKLSVGSRIARYVIPRCRTVFADGSHVRDSLDDLLGYPSRAILQPMGVHTKLFRPTAKDSQSERNALSPQDYIISVGRFVEKKGTIYLIRAMSKVREILPSLKLILIGDGPDRAVLENEVTQLSLNEHVSFLGRLSHSEIIPYLQRAKLAVVPSIIDRYGETEGMPTVVLEAMAAGLGVVGSAVDGIPDVIEHEKNGWLCPEKDPPALATSIINALKSSGANDIANYAMQTSRYHDWCSVVERYLGSISPTQWKPTC